MVVLNQQPAPRRARRDDLNRLADYMGYCPHRREDHMRCGTRDGRTHCPGGDVSTRAPPRRPERAWAARFRDARSWTHAGGCSDRFESEMTAAWVRRAAVADGGRARAPAISRPETAEASDARRVSQPRSRSLIRGHEWRDRRARQTPGGLPDERRGRHQQGRGAVGGDSAARSASAQSSPSETSRPRRRASGSRSSSRIHSASSRVSTNRATALR
jgi:hypothetical protein